MPRSPRETLTHGPRRLARDLRRRIAPPPPPPPPERRPSRAVRAAARAAGWSVGRGQVQLLTDLVDALDVFRRAPRVLVVGNGTPRGFTEIITAHRPRARVLEVDGGTDPEELHVRLALAGPFDVVVDDVRADDGGVDVFERTFFHLRRHGTYLVTDTRIAGAKKDRTEEEPATTRGGGSRPESLLRLLARLVELRHSGVRAQFRHRPLNEVTQAEAVGTLTIQGRRAVVTARRHGVPKLREEATNAYLERRGPQAGRIVHQTPPATLEARSVVTETGETTWDGEPRWLQTFTSPPMSLREYAGPVCAPGAVVATGGVLVADSFRHLQRPELRNRGLEDLSPRFAIPKVRLRPRETLEGSYFHLDNEFRGHFGHAMTEQLSHLWALDRAREEDPDLKVLVSRTDWGQDVHEFERLLYGTMGVGPDDYVLIDRPVRVERLFAATPMFSQPSYVHPDIEALWTRVGDRLAEQAQDLDHPRRIFCRRSGGHRACTNNAEVERLFEKHGFTIVLPEQLPLPDQVRMFSEAEVVAGYSGSVLFNTALVRRPTHVIAIASQTYSPRNEHLIAAVLGHRLHVLRCRSVVPLEEDFSWRQFGSDYTFDIEREGRYVADLLEALPPR